MQIWAKTTKEYYQKEYLCKDKIDYLKAGYLESELKEVKGFPNAHQPGGNNRRKAMSTHVKYLNFDSTDQCFVRDTIAIGGTKRYEMTKLARISLIPNLDIADYARHDQMTNPMNIKIKMKFEDFVVKYKPLIEKIDPLYIFYDVLYYIDLKCEHFHKEGLVGFGAMHIYKKDGPLVFDTEFGFIEKTKDGVIMYTDGNAVPYQHVSKYEGIVNTGVVEIDKNEEWRLLMIREVTFDCVSTNYITFHIVKTKIKDQIIEVPMKNRDFMQSIDIGNGNKETVNSTKDGQMVRYRIDVQTLERSRTIFVRYLEKLQQQGVDFDNEYKDEEKSKKHRRNLKLAFWKNGLGLTNEEIRDVIKIIIEQYNEEI